MFDASIRAAPDIVALRHILRYSDYSLHQPLALEEDACFGAKLYDCLLQGLLSVSLDADTGSLSSYRDWITRTNILLASPFWTREVYSMATCRLRSITGLDL